MLNVRANSSPVRLQPLLGKSRGDNMVRKIDGLVWVRAVEAPPFRLAGRSRKGVLAKGLRYERDFSEFLNQTPFLFIHGQWWEYQDAKSKGYSYAQTDHFSEASDRIVLVETKLTQSLQGEAQLSRLYEPLLQRNFNKPIVKVQAFKNAKYTGTGKKIENITQAFCEPITADIQFLQWLGKL